MEYIGLFLILLVPGLIGAIAYSIVESLKTKCDIRIALIFDLLTFTTMITGLFFFKHILTCNDLIKELCCLSFARNYILLSIWINIVYGVIFGLLRRCFFWLRNWQELIVKGCWKSTLLQIYSWFLEMKNFIVFTSSGSL